MPSAKQLGRYRLLRSLGEGGMGVVYLAKLLAGHGFEKLVAVKCLHPRLTSDSERTDALLREAMLGVSLSHEHIVDVLDVGEDDGVYYVVMEYVRGVSLAHVLGFMEHAEESVPAPIAVFIARAIARALVHVHKATGPEGQTILHGDVSPGNILLGIDGRIKLTDFGVAKVAEESDDQVAGKLAYLPPDAFSGSRPVQAWDAYSLVASLLVALGSPPAPQFARRIVRHARKNGAREVLQRELPDALYRLIDRGLSDRLERRYPTAASLVTGLDSTHERRLDGDEYRLWIESIYRSQAFVARHGEIPTVSRWAVSSEAQTAFAETARALPTTPRSSVARAQIVRFGLSPAVGLQAARELGAKLDEYLSSMIGREVTSTVVSDYRGLVDGLCEGDLDIAWMPPLSFLQAWERGADVIVAMTRAGGAAAYHGALFARAGSGRDSLESLRGARIGWVSRDSASGYVYPMAAIVDHFGDLDGVVAKQHFFGSHRAVCEAVTNDWVDVGASYAQLGADGKVVSAGWLDLDPEAHEGWVVTAISQAIPTDNIANRPHLPHRLKELLTTAFLRFSECAAGKQLACEIFSADGFVAGDIEMYEGARIVHGSVRAVADY